MKPNRLIFINLRLSENLICEIDQLAEREDSSRTEVVRTALRLYIGRRQKLQTIFSIVEQRGEAAGINTPEDIQATLYQSTSPRF